MSTPLSNLRLSHEKYVTIKFSPSMARQLVETWYDADWPEHECYQFIDEVIDMLADALELREADAVWTQSSEK